MYMLQVELCIQILSDVMELLFRQDVGSTKHDTTEVMKTLLRTVIQTSIAYDRSKQASIVVSSGVYDVHDSMLNCVKVLKLCMIRILHQHFHKYRNSS
jgi:hypothetical protein